MYIKAFYSLVVSFVAVFAQIVMLFTVSRDPATTIIFFGLTCVAVVALFTAEILQRNHMRLSKMHRAYEYRAHRAQHGY